LGLRHRGQAQVECGHGKKYARPPYNVAVHGFSSFSPFNCLDLGQRIRLPSTQIAKLRPRLRQNSLGGSGQRRPPSVSRIRLSKLLRKIQQSR
jgi:hypothetical protein